ncbi:hypothetical protein WR25_19589 [Diploscapter pachys]|uniref:Ricin B lectin domain-containing protein n=1 Tax=Diploscapter pachys TaxID=2018661 RepID=A0A2A2LCG3_9BILA|nr:hypothetical protein WR25_19589 [Diploscapter pachys]
MTISSKFTPAKIDSQVQKELESIHKVKDLPPFAFSEDEYYNEILEGLKKNESFYISHANMEFTRDSKKPTFTKTIQFKIPDISSPMDKLPVLPPSRESKELELLTFPQTQATTVSDRVMLPLEDLWFSDIDRFSPDATSVKSTTVIEPYPPDTSSTSTSSKKTTTTTVTKPLTTTTTTSTTTAAATTTTTKLIQLTTNQAVTESIPSYPPPIAVYPISKAKFKLEQAKEILRLLGNSIDVRLRARTRVKNAKRSHFMGKTLDIICDGCGKIKYYGITGRRKLRAVARAKKRVSYAEDADPKPLEVINDIALPVQVASALTPLPTISTVSLPNPLKVQNPSTPKNVMTDDQQAYRISRLPPVYAPVAGLRTNQIHITMVSGKRKKYRKNLSKKKLLRRNELKRPTITRNRRVPIAVKPVVPVEPPISQSIIKWPIFRRRKRRVRKLRIHGTNTAINIRQPIGFPIILDEFPASAAHRNIRTRRKSRIQAIRAKNLNLFGHHHRSFLDPEDKSEAAREPLNLKPPKYARFNAPHATKPHDPDEIQTLLRILQDEQATRRFVKRLSQKQYIHLKDIIVGLRRKIKKSRRYRPRSWGRRSNYYRHKHYPRSRVRTSFHRPYHRRHGYRRSYRRGHRYGRNRIYAPYQNIHYKVYRDTPISHTSKKSRTDKHQKVWKRVGKHKDGARFWDPEIILGKVWKPKAIHRHLLEDLKMIDAKGEKKKELMKKKKKKEEEEEKKKRTRKRSKDRKKKKNRKKFGKKLRAKARGRKAGRKSEGRRRTTKPPDVMEWVDQAIERSGYRFDEALIAEERRLLAAQEQQQQEQFDTGQTRGSRIRRRYIGVGRPLGVQPVLRRERRRKPARRRKSIRNWILLLIGGYLFVVWNREGHRTYYDLNSDFHDGNVPNKGFYDVKKFETGQGKGWHKIPDYSIRREGPGENGASVHLEGEERKLADKQIKELFMNVIASDKISLDRSIPDSRNQDCRKMTYPSDLPSASVVIVFTNEFFSSVMRTVHSIVNRSPPHLLHEVILVDDVSDREELGDKLSEHIKRFGSLVKLIRSKERLGLIRAKLMGARAATGDVLIFLDAHCEANTGWIEPILARIKESPSAVVLPVIDSISDSSMQYMGGSHGGVGSFWWSLHYSMDELPESERLRRKNPNTDYIRSPTMPGGLFAANREYFFHIGSYDEEMDIWGGENLEISFRVWMCGGSLEILPCSHVGHIYRSGHPYDMTGRNNNKDVHGTNSKRLADVWMDEYKRYFYMYRIGLKDSTDNIGDLTSRIELRKRLKCHSFKWFVSNIATNKFLFDENVYAFGNVSSSNGICLDTLQRHDHKMQVNLGIYQCQGGGSSSQMFSISKEKELRREVSCVDVGGRVRDDTFQVIVRHCNKHKPIQFEHKQGGGLLKHIDRNLCLDMEGLNSGDDLFFKKCDESKSSQQWKFANYYPEFYKQQENVKVEK